MTLRKRLSRFFAALTGAPQDWSAEEVAARLRKFLDDTATRSEWDYFCSGIRLLDPRLEAIRDEAGELDGPRVEPYTSDKLRELIQRAEMVRHKAVEQPE